MLHWIDKAGTTPWSTGSAEVSLDQRGPTGNLPVAVWCRFGSLQTDELALLDTGAQYTLIGPQIIELLGDELGASIGPITTSSRLGTFKGTMHRLPVHLIAHQGQSLTVEATVAAYPQWEGPSVLGFKGFLDRFRFALDPGERDVPARIYFGQVSHSVTSARRKR